MLRSYVCNLNDSHECTVCCMNTLIIEGNKAFLAHNTTLGAGALPKLLRRGSQFFRSIKTTVEVPTLFSAPYHNAP